VLLTRFETCLFNNKRRLPLREIWAVNKACNAFASLALAQVDPERGGVPDNVPADGFCRVSEEDRRVGHHLVGHKRNRVVLIDA